MNRRNLFKAAAGSVLAWCGIGNANTNADVSPEKGECLGTNDGCLAALGAREKDDGHWTPDGHWIFRDGSRWKVTATVLKTEGGKYNVWEYRRVMPDGSFVKLPCHQPVFERLVYIEDPDWLEKYERLYDKLPVGMFWRRNNIGLVRTKGKLVGIAAQMSAAWSSTFKGRKA